MRNPASLTAAMEQARRECPAALPEGFSTDLMARLKQEQGSPRVSAFPLPMAFAIACSAVLTASAVSLLPSFSKPQPEPPSLGIFRSPAAHAPFATP